MNWPFFSLVCRGHPWPKSGICQEKAKKSNKQQKTASNFRSAPKGRQQMEETGFCQNLRFSAVSCENLRFHAQIERAENQRKSANVRSGSGFSLLLSPFWRTLNLLCACTIRRVPLNSLWFAPPQPRDGQPLLALLRPRGCHLSDPTEIPPLLRNRCSNTPVALCFLWYRRLSQLHPHFFP